MNLIYIICILFLFVLTGCSIQEKDINTPENFNQPSATQNETSQNATNSINTHIKVNETDNLDLFSYTTTIYTKTTERQNNVEIACQELSNTIVAPGETFSFCDTLGPAKSENGYQKADSFDSDGDIYKEYGGRKVSSK